MLKVSVTDDDESGTSEVAFTFDGRSGHDLRDMAALLQASRVLAPHGSRLGAEIEAHIAYVQTLERWLMGQAVPLPGEESKG